MPIRVLDAATVGRIAAGEVVERPSSVVKELIENAIDAGATSITVEIRGGGIDYLRVTDNGCGIEPGQVRLAFENHATSKLQTADQLDDIRTLGFRGEALPSIASVSHVEMTTRAKGQDTGVRLNIDGGADLRVREVGCPEGTTFVMKDLFYNIPVRRAFLKKPNYEGGLVCDTVARMMLGNPNVSMRLINNGNTTYHSFGDGKLRHAVFAVYGKETAEQMVEVDASEGGTHIHGLIGVGELAKNTRAHQVFFINGRYVRCQLLIKALEEVCRTRVTIGMYPMCVLNIMIPPASVNVNVHPNKLEVRFKDEIAMRTIAERLLATAFEDEHVLQLEPEKLEERKIERVSTVREISPMANPGSHSVQSLDNPSKKTVVVNDQTEVSSQKTAIGPSSIPVQPRKPENGVQMDLFHRTVEAEIKKLASKSSDSASLREPKDDFEAAISKLKAMPVIQTAPVPDQKPEIANQRAHMPTQPEERVDYRVIGVVFNTYILIEVGDAMVLIDQHAAHERLQYEKFTAQLEAGLGSQQLLTPLIVHVTSREMALIRDNLEVLSDSGYTVEPFGEQDIQVRAVPYILGRAELKPAFMDVIDTLNRLRSATIDLRRSEVMQMSCKSAVKGGDPLSEGEIQSLLEQMLATGAPPTCPHGRPVMKSISRRELEKMFKRIQ